MAGACSAGFSTSFLPAAVFDSLWVAVQFSSSAKAAADMSALECINLKAS